MKQVASRAYLLFDPEDGGVMSLQNVGWLSLDYMALYLRRQKSSMLFNLHKFIVKELHL
jgi:hypothetical protein